MRQTKKQLENTEPEIVWPQNRSGHGGKTELIECAENETLVVQLLSQFISLSYSF